MLDSTVVAADIARLVQNSPNQRVLGSELAVLLKRGYPDFRAEDFGCRNLREFIRRYAKAIFEDGRKGTDVSYSAAILPGLSDVASRQQEFSSISAPAARINALQLDKSVWKTFVSPSAPYRTYANRETGELRVLSLAHPAPGDPWVNIPSCSAEIHVQIAREFLDGLADESAKSQLVKILGLDSWWEHFFFSARSFGVERQWSAFRRRRLHEEFERQLQNLGIPRFSAGRLKPTPALCAERSAPGGETEDSAVKRAAIAVIRRLSDSQVRDLQLPLGSVLDVLGEK